MAYVVVNKGVIWEAENNVRCPHCTRPMKWDEFEDNLSKAKIPLIKKKCPGCKRFFGISGGIDGRFVGYEL